MDWQDRPNAVRNTKTPPKKQAVGLPSFVVLQSAEGRTPSYIASHNVGRERRFRNGPAHRKHGYEGRTPRRILTEWLLRSCFQLWPRKRHQVIPWFMANILFYLVHQRRTLSIMDYIDTKSNSQLLVLVSFVFRDKILKHIHTLKC